MTEETTYQFLRRREQELIAQITARRGQLAPKEAELAQIQHMKALLEPGQTSAPSVLTQRNSNSLVEGFRAFATRGLPASAKETLAGGATAFNQMTIKELIIQAFLDAYQHGAGANDIREFIRTGYGRSIDPGSFRSQMHRLKADNIIRQNGLDDSWNLDPERRKLYSRYNHPSSRKAMKELQDDEPDDSEKPPGS